MIHQSPFPLSTKGPKTSGDLLIAVNNSEYTSALQYFIYIDMKLYLIRVPGILQLNQWHHIAAVSGRNGMKLYLNGVLVGTHDYTGSFSAINGGNDQIPPKPPSEKGGQGGISPLRKGDALWEKRLKGDAKPILVHGDEGKLRQVLMNLLSNAVKFTESGEVVLRVSPQHAKGQEEKMANGQLPLSPLTNLPLFMFEVIDTGIGISPEDVATIFETFAQSKSQSGGDSHTKDQSRTNKEGTGLGLTIAKGYVQLMGGELDFESSAEKGSRFFFTIPLEPTTEGVTPSSVDTVRQVVRLAAGYQVKALVADDNQENREVLSQMLSDIGVTVILAENGQQVLEAVPAEGPDIVFMDIWMPVMDGLETTQHLLRRIRGRTPKTGGGFRVGLSS